MATVSKDSHAVSITLEKDYVQERPVGRDTARKEFTSQTSGNERGDVNNADESTDHKD